MIIDKKQLSLEGEINVNEASKALQKMNDNKSPGSDGFMLSPIYLPLIKPV
jgi:hypothetical protein